MRPQPVTLPGAGPSTLPFSPAVIAGNLVYTAGMVGMDNATRIAKEGIQAQTEQTFENLKAALAAAGTSLEYVVKANVYLVNMEDFAAMNEVYRRYFPNNPPARTTVGVKLAREDLLIEIEMVALLPDGGGA